MMSLESIREFAAIFFLCAGAFFLMASVIGMLRLPDFYTRIHASGNSETLATMFIFTGLIIYEGLTMTSAKLVLIMGFVFLANPIGSHILSKSAYKSGYPVWQVKEVKENKEEGGECDHADLHH